MTFSCDEQLSGVAELDFFLLEEVSNWPEILSDSNSAQLEFNPSVHSVEAVIKPDSISVPNNKNTKNFGIAHAISIKMEFLTRSEALEQLLEQYENKPGIARAKFNNGFQKIYGSNTEPLYMIYEDVPGTKIDGEGTTVIEIKGETANRPVFYTVL
jgi:hypothetical protein